MSQARSDRPRRRSHTLTLAPQFPTTNEIAARTYELFEAEGRQIAKIFEYWQRAEYELLVRAVERTPVRSAIRSRTAAR